jgi:hypothetical protein
MRLRPGRRKLNCELFDAVSRGARNLEHEKAIRHNPVHAGTLLA